MFILIRALTYSTLFIGFLLVFVPARILARSGVPAIPVTTVRQVVGMTIAAAGIAIGLWCILTFVFAGKGTPAPFDPPRRLVVRGPYRYVRNPMYLGAGLALAGAALAYRSLSLFGYAIGFLLVTQVFVLGHEEPTLRQTFGSDYESYCNRVGRWLPRFRPKNNKSGSP